jgi:hypothetical protein
MELEVRISIRPQGLSRQRFAPQSENERPSHGLIEDRTKHMINRHLKRFESFISPPPDRDNERKCIGPSLPWLVRHPRTNVSTAVLTTPSAHRKQSAVIFSCGTSKLSTTARNACTRAVR